MKFNADTKIDAGFLSNIRKMLREDKKLPEFDCEKVAYLTIPESRLWDVRCNIGYIPIELCNFEPIGAEAGVLESVHIFTSKYQDHISVDIVERRFKLKPIVNNTAQKMRLVEGYRKREDASGDFMLGVTVAAGVMAGAME